jgi:hypothetical protein
MPRPPASLHRLNQLTGHVLGSGVRQATTSSPRSAYKKRSLEMNPAHGGERDPRTIAMLVIGDEVLGGKTQDTNSHVNFKTTDGNGELFIARVLITIFSFSASFWVLKPSIETIRRRRGLTFPINSYFALKPSTPTLRPLVPRQKMLRPRPGHAAD